MIRRLGFGLSILLLAVLAGVITFWVVMRPAATNSETRRPIQPKDPTPTDA
jgi:hypothetical protein